MTDDALRERAFNEWRDNDQYSTLVAPKEYRAFRAGVEFGAAEARKNGVPWEKTAAARAVADAARRPLVEALLKVYCAVTGFVPNERAAALIRETIPDEIAELRGAAEEGGEVRESYECGPGNHRNCQHTTDDALRERARALGRSANSMQEAEFWKAGYAAGAAEARKDRDECIAVGCSDTAAMRHAVCYNHRHLLKEPEFALAVIRADARRPLVEALRKIVAHAHDPSVLAIAKAALAAEGGER